VSNKELVSFTNAANNVSGYFTLCSLVDLTTAAGSNQVPGRSDLQFKFGLLPWLPSRLFLSRVNITAPSLWLAKNVGCQPTSHFS